MSLVYRREAALNILQSMQKLGTANCVRLCMCAVVVYTEIENKTGSLHAPSQPATCMVHASCFRR
jgi:hypothetical protein